MSPQDEPVYDSQTLSTNVDTDSIWDNPNTCLRLNLLCDSKEEPLVVYKRMEFFRQMVSRSVYSEYPSAASIAADKDVSA